MKTKVLWLSSLVLVIFNESTYCLNNNQPLIPLMGFSAWNEFGCTISEGTLVNTGNLMIQKHSANWEGKQISLRDAGYTYVNIDDCWHAKTRDEQGNPEWDSQKFPRGLRWLSDTLHQMGLKTGRSIVFSKSNRGQYNVHQWGDTVGHLWRTGTDITPVWGSILANITSNSVGAQYVKPGAWNNPDMMEVGNGTLTYEENRAHFDLWCISAAPLILGNDLSKMTDSIFSILTNREVIAVNQDSLGYQGRMVRTDGNIQIWTKKLRNGAWAVVLVNDGTVSANSSVTWSDIGESDTTRSFPVRDLWQHKIVSQSAKGSYVVNNIPAHGTVHLVVGSAYWMEPVSIDNVICGNDDLRDDNTTSVKVKKHDITTEIYIPFASSTITIFDIQGKKSNSFYVNKPSWKTIPNSLTNGKISVIQIVAKGDKEIRWACTE